jgi:hypothetical protein
MACFHVGCEMKPKVYLETTIPSLLTAWPSRDVEIAAQQLATREWWDTRRSYFELFVSPEVNLPVICTPRELMAQWPE